MQILEKVNHNSIHIYRFTRAEVIVSSSPLHHSLCLDFNDTTLIFCAVSCIETPRNKERCATHSVSLRCFRWPDSFPINAPRKSKLEFTHNCDRFKSRDDPLNLRPKQLRYRTMYTGLVSVLLDPAQSSHPSRTRSPVCFSSRGPR